MPSDMQLTQMQETGEVTYVGAVTVGELTELADTLGIPVGNIIVVPNGDIQIKAQVVND